MVWRRLGAAINFRWCFMSLFNVDKKRKVLSHGQFSATYHSKNALKARELWKSRTKSPDAIYKRRSNCQKCRAMANVSVLRNEFAFNRAERERNVRWDDDKVRKKGNISVITLLLFSRADEKGKREGKLQNRSTKKFFTQKIQSTSTSLYSSS